MDTKDLSKEDELVILEEGLKSHFWQVLSQRYSQRALTAGGAALSERVEHRDWMAGNASGLKEALNYPAERIRAIRTYLKQQSTKPL